MSKLKCMRLSYKAIQGTEVISNLQYYKQFIEIAVNLRRKTIQGITFEIFSKKYCTEIHGIMIRIYKTPPSS